MTSQLSHFRDVTLTVYTGNNSVSGKSVLWVSNLMPALIAPFRPRSLCNESIDQFCFT